MNLDDFDYRLPPESIAQHPAAVRSASRLLLLPAQGPWQDSCFASIATQLAPGDLLVLNDTRVLRARLFGTKTDSGGKVELLIERIGTPAHTSDGMDPHEALAMARTSKPLRPGGKLLLGDARAEVLERRGELWHLRFDEPVSQVLQREGLLPLPPYIEHAPQDEDEQRYQTIFAAHDGSVAAPTAGLHFDEPTLQALRDAGIATATITLHVGAGTFTPVRVADPREHRMHAERYELSAATAQAIEDTRARGGRVVAVGSTVLRTLETVAAEHGHIRPAIGETSLFALPGYRFRVVDRLLTNFHLPKSTLLMLVCAFAGSERVLAAYRHAVEAGYRFFSYGDAMLIDRNDTNGSPVC